MNSNIAIVAAIAAAAGAAGAQTLLIDFGTDNTFRGASVTSPDVNGNHWNSLDSLIFNTNLVDTGGNGTGINLGFSALGGTDSFNGPLTDGGGFGDPSLPGLGAGLGDLAIGEAAFDYFVDTSFDIFNLDPSKQVELTFYSARKFAPNATTEYSIFSDNSPGATLLATATLNVQDPGSPWLSNLDSVASVTVTPGGGGTLTIDVAGFGGGSGYINALSIRVIPTPASAALLGLGGLAFARRRR